jgi:hypothetical protein
MILKKYKILIIVSLAIGLFSASLISAVEYTLDQFSTTTPDIPYYINHNHEPAQTFTAGTTADIGKVVVKLYKYGNPSGNVWIEIWTDGIVSPDTKIATSSSIDVSTLTTDTDGSDYSFFFDIGTTLTNGSKYWIIADVDYGYSETDYVVNRLKNEGTYAGGNTFYFDTTWQSTVWDFYFLEYTQPEATPTPSPSPAIINISGGMISGILSAVSNLFADLNLFFILLVGLPLAFWVIKKIIELLRSRKS